MHKGGGKLKGKPGLKLRGDKYGMKKGSKRGTKGASV